METETHWFMSAMVWMGIATGGLLAYIFVLVPLTKRKRDDSEPTSTSQDEDSSKQGLIKLYFRQKGVLIAGGVIAFCALVYLVPVSWFTPQVVTILAVAVGVGLNWWPAGLSMLGVPVASAFFLYSWYITHPASYTAIFGEPWGHEPHFWASAILVIFLITVIAKKQAYEDRFSRKLMAVLYVLALVQLYAPRVWSYYEWPTPSGVFDTDVAWWNEDDEVQGLTEIPNPQQLINFNAGLVRDVCLKPGERSILLRTNRRVDLYPYPNAFYAILIRGDGGERKMLIDRGAYLSEKPFRPTVDEKWIQFEAPPDREACFLYQVVSR